MYKLGKYKNYDYIKKYGFSFIYREKGSCAVRVLLKFKSSPFYTDVKFDIKTNKPKL